MSKTIVLEDNQMAIVVTIDSTDECIRANVMAFHGKAGTLESVDVFPRNSFGTTNDFDKQHGLKHIAQTRQRYERSISYKNGNGAAMKGAIKQASRNIAMIWSNSVQSWIINQLSRPTF